VSDKIWIKYFLNNEVYAARSRRHVPRLGDQVRFNNICYTINMLIWVEDEMDPYVVIDIRQTDDIGE